MPFQLRKTISVGLNVDISQWEKVHGSQLFEKRLSQTVSQNSKVKQVDISPSHKYLEIYENIQEWQIEEYNLPETLKQCTQVFRSISGIRFTQLKILNLSGLGITNIQCLNWLQTQNLQHIDLRRNKIVTVKAIAKLYIQKSVNLMLHDNPVDSLQLNSRDYNYISRSRNLLRQIDKFYLFAIKRQIKYFMFGLKDDKSNRAKAILDLSVKLGIQ